jgi:hypothetical protein
MIQKKDSSLEAIILIKRKRSKLMKLKSLEKLMKISYIKNSKKDESKN